jgi:hypothetical protein
MISALRDQGVPVGAGSGGSAPGTRSTAASAPTDRDTGSGRRRYDPGSPPGPRPDRDGRRSLVPVALGSLVVVAVLLTIALLRPGAEPDLVTIDHDEEASSAPTSDTGVGGSSPPATAADAPSSTEAGPVDGDLTAPSSLDGAASQADTGPTTAHSEPQVTQTEPPLPGPPVADPPDTTGTTEGPTTRPTEPDPVERPRIEALTSSPDEIWEQQRDGSSCGEPSRSEVSARVTHPTGLASVELHWAVDGERIGSARMTASDAAYTALLGPFAAGAVREGASAEVVLTVVATSHDGITSTAQRSVTLHACRTPGAR